MVLTHYVRRVHSKMLNYIVFLVPISRFYFHFPTKTQHDIQRTHEMNLMIITQCSFVSVQSLSIMKTIAVQ